MAKPAPAIAGATFKEFKTSLEEVEPVLLEAAERVLGSRSAKAVEKLLEEAKKAIARGSRPWADLRKTARSVRGRVVRPEHAAVTWALLEASLRELSGVADKALPALREAAERLARGEAAVVPAKDIAELEQRARDVAHRLRLSLEEMAKYAEELAGGDVQRAEIVRKEAEALRRAFAVTYLAEELAEANAGELSGLGGATLADKLVAFFESLTRGTAWSRVVLNAAERGEAYRALILAPETAYKLSLIHI